MENNKEQTPLEENRFLNEAEYYFEKYKQTFKGVSAGDYVDKEDFMLIINKLFLAITRKPATTQTH